MLRRKKRAVKMKRAVKIMRPSCSFAYRIQP